MKRRNEHGFSMIELLVVIVVLGVLSTVVVLGVAGITDRGKRSACQADYETTANAVETHYARTGEYPIDQSQMVADGILRSPSSKYGLSPDRPGDVDPRQGSSCYYDPDDDRPDNAPYTTVNRVLS